MARLEAKARHSSTLAFIEAGQPGRRLVARAPSNQPRTTREKSGVALPTADILREAASHRVFTHEAVLGAWAVDQHAGLDDLAEGASSWDKVYFEKGDYGSVRVRGKRVRFTFEHDETTHCLRIVLAGTAADDALVGVLDTNVDHARFVGTRRGRPFELSLTRELSFVGEPAVTVVKAR